MKHLVALLMLWLAASSLLAQEWTWQHPQPTGNSLNKVFALSPTSCIAVGALGTVVRTEDGGLTWTNLTHGMASEFRDVYFRNPSVGWVVGGQSGCTPFSCGSYGMILHTVDGARSWSTQLFDTSRCLNSVAFSGDTGWVVGDYGIILCTTDAGEHWSRQPSNILYPLTDVFCLNGRWAWAVGELGIVVRTTDGGAHWSLAHLDRNCDLKAVTFADSLNGWVVGGKISALDAVISRTTDGGATWEPQAVPIGIRCWLYDVQFNNNKGFAVGDFGTILHTTNGGSEWTVAGVDSSNALYGIALTDNRNAWAVGAHGAIVHTSDAWNERVSASNRITDADLCDIRFPDNTHGWALGNYCSPSQSVLLSTSDGGASWTEWPVAAPGTLHSVFFTDAQTGWVAGGTSGAVILHTKNGGAGWIEQFPNVNGSVSNIFFTDTQTGWAVGHENDSIGVILHTTDEGTTWNRQGPAALNPLEDVFFLDNSEGWAVGSNATVLHTTNAGEQWNLLKHGTHYGLNTVVFRNQQEGWIAGSDLNLGSAVILHTVNDGLSWVIQCSGQGRSIVDLVCTRTGMLGAVGQTGTLLLSYNNGESWLPQPPMFAGDFGAIADNTLGTLFVVGKNGTVLRYGDLASAVPPDVNHNPLLASSYSLSAYPNPFNPSTTISFSLPQAGNVRLSVFDLTGRLVRILSDETMQAGEHSVTFDGTNLPSGIYFARLEADRNSQTRKLILLK